MINKDRVIGQMLIVMVKRAGGIVNIPILEADDTGQDTLKLEVSEDKKELILKVEKKH